MTDHPICWRLGRNAASRYRKLGAVMWAAVLAVLALPSLATAHDDRIRDGNDTKGALDIRATSLSDGRRFVWHGITTFDGWPLRAISGRQSPLNYLAVGFNLKGDASFDRFLLFVQLDGRLRALWLTRSGYVLTRFPASRPNKRTVAARVPRYLLEDGGGYTWAALTVFHRRGHEYVDWAPRRVALHDLLPPKIVSHQKWDISTYVSATSVFPIDFTISDYAQSAGVDWRLERRVLGSSVWEAADSGEGVGAHTAELIGEDGGNYFVRFVARDRQGNATVTKSTRLSFPTDDANPLFAGSYSGAWSTEPAGDPYLGTLH
jgi:hypothetical protein